MIRSVPEVRRAALAAGVLLIAALLLRGGRFGSPLAGLDEQFYLLVGDRIWQGALPYVDIWDRKPAGLFLLFAAIRVLPGDGVLAAQVVATLFAAATGFLVALAARRTTGWTPATMAGVAYLAGLNQLWGATPQAPVFYNLPVAAAALLTFRAGERPRGDRGAGMLAMLLAGLAVQIKTNAVFEGAFFGLWLVAATWTATRSPAATLRRAGLLALVGALPTLAVAGTYLALGAFPQWWQANVGSVLAKGYPHDAISLLALAETATSFAPFAIVAAIGLGFRAGRWTRADAFALGWIAVAAIDFVAIGGYWPHYALPLLLACAPVTASAFALRLWGPVLFALAVAAPLVHATRIAPANAARQRAVARAVTAALPPDVRTECLFIYDGPPIYYHLTRACLVSRFAYPAHLSTVREARALGTDPAAALRGAIARRPGTVLTVEGARWVGRDDAQEAIALVELRRGYRPVARLPYGPSPETARIVVWRRADLAAR